MVSRTIVTLVDDLDGKEVGDSGRTIGFSYDGVDYQIDLGFKNLGKLEKALDPFIAAATKVGGRRAGGRSARVAGSSDDTKAIRQWARDNGYEISERGRIPAAVLEAWHAAP
jgi:hypothetical protein